MVSRLLEQSEKNARGLKEIEKKREEKKKMEKFTKKLYEKMIKNGGLTINRHMEELTYNRGYMVSVYGYEKKLDDFSFEEVEKVVSEYQQIVKGALYIGFWIDNGVLYIDISKYIYNKSQALKFGKQNKQIAIFDIENQESIEIHYLDFYYITDTKNKDLTIATIDTLEEIKDVLKIKHSVRSIKNALYQGKLLLDRYEVHQEYFNLDDMLSLGMEG